MSEKYIVSARKYRPSTFRSVVGQQNLTSTLKGAIASGRLAHAYLFCGPRGVGKTSCARIFARTINCLNPDADGEACGVCDSCRSIDEGNSFNIVELDAASNNSVDDIRTIIEQVSISPQVGKYRVFIIDEVHMLSPSAFNAFLKTLEEPPSYAIFILATTEKHKVIPTILSRCQIYDFKRITINDTVDHLAYVAGEEHIEADRKALGVIARKADGAMRDALSIFDQLATSTHGHLSYEAVVENLNVLDYDVFFKLIDTFAAGNTSDALLLYKDIRDRGFDSLFFVNSLAQHVRDLMVAVDPRTVSLLETPQDVAERLIAQAKSLPLQWYFAALKLLNDCDLNYRISSNKQLLVELTLIRLTQLLTPATPPFDMSDRPVAMRNPSESPKATVQPVAPPQASPAGAAAQTASAATSASPAPAPAQPSAAPEPKVAQVSPLPRHEVHAAPGTAPAGKPMTRRLTTQGATTQVSLERKRNPFTDQQFLGAWQTFIDATPDQHILISAMRTAAPRRTGEFEFDVIVEHPAQQQAFELAMPRLLQFLRERLGNDFLTVHATINPEKEASKFIPPHEFVKKIVRENPEMGALLESLEMELS